MITAGIKDTKNNLSRYLSRVKAGEEVVITERGKPVARLVKEEAGKQSIQAALAPLIKKGLIVLPSRELIKRSLVRVKAPGKLVSEMVIEDRR
jgi:prevent-host-death family protein